MWRSSSESEAGAASNSGTLDFLLRRMRHKSDFPALSDSIARIQRIAASENESLASLSSEILKDVALTNKLLRLVNSAHFTHAGGGSISTVSRAVALIGRDAEAIAAALAHTGVPLQRHDTLEAAVPWCFAQAQEGDAVLLSPACASLDMFRNYAHRAEVFVATVNALAAERGEIGA